MTDWKHSTGAAIRHACRVGELTGPTPGMALGYVQANLVVVPKEFAFDFLVFCQRNPKPCPLLDVTEPGDPCPAAIAPGSDLRTDLPAYRVWREGQLVDEPSDILRLWRDDLVSFVIGCSFTFESALLKARLPVRHIEQGLNVPMFVTSRPCRSAGRFRGPLVVSMRPMTPKQAINATRVCADSRVRMARQFISATRRQLASATFCGPISATPWRFDPMNCPFFGPAESRRK